MYVEEDFLLGLLGKLEEKKLRRTWQDNIKEDLG
jgi:hypothetical protein